MALLYGSSPKLFRLFPFGSSRRALTSRARLWRWLVLKVAKARMAR